MQWMIDPVHSSASFAVRHMMVTTVRGSFKDVAGTITFDPNNRANSAVEAVIQANSIDSGTTDRDNHLRSPDFFNVEQHPEIAFKSTGFALKGEDEGVLTGDLTIAGVTQSVELSVEFLGQGKSPFGDMRAGFTAETRINREDFGLTWNQALETGGFLVGQEVKITLDIQGVLVTETEPA